MADKRKVDQGSWRQPVGTLSGQAARNGVVRSAAPPLSQALQRQPPARLEDSIAAALAEGRRLRREIQERIERGIRPSL